MIAFSENRSGLPVYRGLPGRGARVWIAPENVRKFVVRVNRLGFGEVVSDIPEQKDEDMYRALVEPEVRRLNQLQDMQTPGICSLYGLLRANIKERRPCVISTDSSREQRESG